MEEKGKYIEEKIVYFKEPGYYNTEMTLQLALERAKARGINKIVVASTKGRTARQLEQLIAGTGIKMVVVPHQYGMIHAQSFPLEMVPELEQKGHHVYFSTLLFHTDDFYGSSTPTVMATLLRTFSQGMKVCVEILFMAVNGGCVGMGEKVIAIAGTRRGADTAIVAIGAPSTRLHDFHVLEIICKPLENVVSPVSAGPAPFKASRKNPNEKIPELD